MRGGQVTNVRGELDHNVLDPGMGFDQVKAQTARSFCAVQPILAERSSLATQVAPRGNGPQARACLLARLLRVGASGKAGAVQVTGKIRLIVVP